jgi:hypothetical protein
MSHITVYVELREDQTPGTQRRAVRGADTPPRRRGGDRPRFQMLNRAAGIKARKSRSRR